jgi:hypothetical protein
LWSGGNWRTGLRHKQQQPSALETGRIFVAATLGSTIATTAPFTIANAAPLGSAITTTAPLSSVAAAAAASSSLDILDLHAGKKENEVEGERDFCANLPT